MLEVCHLSRKFGKKEVLKDISYTFEKGVYGLLGPNGAGKTTFIRCILDLYSYQGEIHTEGGNQGVKKNTMKIGYLPQKNGCFPNLTVEEQLLYFANMKELEKEKMKNEVDRVLQLVNLEEKKKEKGKKLSGGMVRRLGIAQALLNQPDLIIFDEPTTGLDPEERMRFKNILKRLGQDAIVILSTHIVEDIETVCDKILIMKEGELVVAGTQEEIKSFAENRVFVVSREKAESADYVEKELDEDRVRVLSKSKMDGELQSPTIEDGYLCILKNIVD